MLCAKAGDFNGIYDRYPPSKTAVQSLGALFFVSLEPLLDFTKNKKIVVVQFQRIIIVGNDPLIDKCIQLHQQYYCH